MAQAPLHFDTAFCRSQFPGLARDFIFMDNAGGSHVPKQVINRISEYLSNWNVQHGASYSVSVEAKKRIDRTLLDLTQFINAKRREEIIIGSSSTMLLRILSLCISRDWSAGDEVIVTNTEHEANASCWTDLEEKGIVIKIWQVNPKTFELDIAELQNLLSSKTKLVAVTHVSNVLGTINPIREIAKAVHKAGALICVDGVAFAPHRRVDVQELGVDFYVLSCYKVFGPHIGLMYGRYDLLKQIRGINHNFIGKDEVPYKFQPGNLNFELTYGLGGALDYLNSVGSHHGILANFYDAIFDLVARQEEILAGKLIAFLKSRKNVQIIGIPDADMQRRVATVSFVVDGISCRDVVLKTDDLNIGIRHGDFYAKKLIETLKLSERGGVIRVSMLHYNSLQEVEKLVEILEKVLPRTHGED